MNKGRRLVLLIICLIFGIGLFMIYTMMSTIDRDDKSKISHLSKSPNNAAVKANRDSSTLNITSRGSGNRTSEPAVLAAPTEAAKSATTVAKSAASDKVNASRSAPARTASDLAPKTAPAPAPKAVAAPAPIAAPAPAPKAAEAPALKVATAPVTKAAPAAETVNEVDLLARLITAEAQSEPYEAKVAVGAVVMNRVQSGVWANTIKEVIYQKINGYYQFTPVQNGWINKPAEAESIKAAQAALSGTDPTNGAQFYYDDTVKNTWILAKPVSVQYGHMIFAF